MTLFAMSHFPASFSLFGADLTAASGLTHTNLYKTTTYQLSLGFFIIPDVKSSDNLRMRNRLQNTPSFYMRGYFAKFTLNERLMQAANRKKIINRVDFSAKTIDKSCLYV